MQHSSSADDGPHDVEDVWHTLTKTSPLLDAVRAGSRPKSGLHAELDVSRSTVHNWCSELVDEGLLDASEGTVELTNTGRYFLNLYDETMATSDVLRTATEVIERVPGRHLPPWRYLSDVDVWEGSAGVSTYRREARELLRRADSVRVLAPGMFAPFLQELIQYDRHDVPSVELVMTEDAFDTAGEAYPELCDESRTENLTGVYVLEADPPFSLSVLEGAQSAVSVGAFGDREFPIGMLSARTDRLVEWGNDVLDEYVHCECASNVWSPDRSTVDRSQSDGGRSPSRSSVDHRRPTDL